MKAAKIAGPKYSDFRGKRRHKTRKEIRKKKIQSRRAKDEVARFYDEIFHEDE